jgi:hypothetical protein
MADPIVLIVTGGVAVEASANVIVVSNSPTIEQPKKPERASIAVAKNFLGIKTEAKKEKADAALLG